MKTLLSYLKPQKNKITLQVSIKFIGSIMDLLLPMLLAFIIDKVVPTKNVKMVFLYGGLMLLASLTSLISNIKANQMSVAISKNTTEKLRHDLFAKTTYLSARQSDETTIPSLLSRLSSDTYHVHQMVDRIQRIGIRAPILLLGGIIITLTLEPVLALILIATLPLLWVIVTHISKKGVFLFSKTQQANDQLVRKVQENVSGIRVIKALSMTNKEIEKFDEANKKLIEREQKASKTMALTGPTMNLILNLGLTAVVLVGAIRINSGLTKPGQIIAFLSYFTIILNALLMVTRLFTLYSRGAASAKRIEDILLLDEEFINFDLENLDNNNFIEFKNVTFSYNKKYNNLENISFALKEYESLGIIGETGSGKSTLVQLLLRFYDSDEGEIYIKGKNIKTLSKEELYSLFGVVFQNDLLFSSSIYENVSFGRNLEKEKVIESLKAAEAQFVYEEGRDLDYQVAIKGANLSGGQKQRLLIARALANNPEILILDDSSSALDYITESKVRNTIRKNYKNTTSIIVAQRVSSIMHLDKIIMLQDGKVIGYGSHNDLLNNCPSYKEIYEAQMGDIVI